MEGDQLNDCGKTIMTSYATEENTREIERIISGYNNLDKSPKTLKST